MNISSGRVTIRYGCRSILPYQSFLMVPSSTIVRTVFMMPKRSTKSKKIKKKVEQKKPVDTQLSRESLELELKIKEMQEFTQRLKQQLKKDKEDELAKKIKDIEKPVDEDSEDVDVIYGELTSGEDQEKPLLLGGESSSAGAISLFDQPAKGISLPPSVLDRIGDTVINIVSKENPNWEPIITYLFNSEKRLAGISKKDTYQFLSQIAIGTLNAKSLQLIHEMLKDQGIKFKTPIYDFFMRHFAALGQTNLVEGFFNQALQDGIEPTSYMYSHLIKVYSRAKDLNKINHTLKMMQNNGVEAGLVIYTNILQLCVRLKDSKQANDIFQMMKFRSSQTKPDITTYNTMIFLSTKENDIYRALDLYRELLDEKLTPDLFTLNCLAICCSKNRDFFIQGWKFINEISERNLTPNHQTFQSMLRLAARDGDLELARALYMTIFRMRSDISTAGSEAFVYLLMAYRDYKFDKEPLISSIEEGIAIRTNALRLVDFLGLHQTIDDPRIENTENPPFLPIAKITHPYQISAESNALWSYHLLRDPENTMTLPNLVTYLRIPIEHNQKEEFLKRFEETTFASPEIKKEAEIEESEEGDKGPEYFGDDDLEAMIQSELDTVEEKESTTNDPEVIIEEPDATELVETEVDSTPEAIKQSKSLHYKIERSSELYITYLSAGKRFRDIDICEKAWVERGQYRKTSGFRSLSKNERDFQDYRFAKEMVLAFVQLRLLEDAIRIVKSTENQFDWTFYVLKPLYMALSKIGDDQNMKIISSICNARKGQVLPGMLKAQQKR